MKMYRYKKSTGEIDAYCDRTVLINPVPPDTDDLGYIATEEFDWNVYVDITTNPPSLIQKTELNLIWDKIVIENDGIDTAVLSGIPNDTKFIVDGQEVIVDDGTLEITSNAVGKVNITLVDFKYKRQSWSIEVI